MTKTRKNLLIRYQECRSNKRRFCLMTSFPLKKRLSMIQGMQYKKEEPPFIHEIIPDKNGASSSSWFVMSSLLIWLIQGPNKYFNCIRGRPSSWCGSWTESQLESRPQWLCWDLVTKIHTQSEYSGESHASKEGLLTNKGNKRRGIFKWRDDETRTCRRHSSKHDRKGHITCTAREKTAPASAAIDLRLNAAMIRFYFEDVTIYTNNNVQIRKGKDCVSRWGRRHCHDEVEDDQQQQLLACHVSQSSQRPLLWTRSSSSGNNCGLFLKKLFALSFVSWCRTLILFMNIRFSI